nr:basic secretory protein-like protein [Alistipes onderdonkii]
MRKTYLLSTVLVAMALGTNCHIAGTHPSISFEPEKRSLDGCKKIVFDAPSGNAVRGYWLVNTAHPEDDPRNWSLWGSDNEKKWVKIDQRLDQTFWARYTEREYAVQLPGKYSKYAFIIETVSGDTLTTRGSHGFRFFDSNPHEGWEDFTYPDVVFHYSSPHTGGSRIYRETITDPESYIRYHARKVCEILFWTDDNPENRNRIDRITYELKDYDGISAKSGEAPDIFISFSTRYIERTARNSILEFCDETRGILYHELAHGYQHQPKGCGRYDGQSEYWAAIEGMADAVRIDAGFHKQRRPDPDGNWMQGYTTTGFFLQWFRTKDPDALRKFHDTMRTLYPWSFDAGVKAVFGKDTTIQELWDEYAQFIRENPGYHHYTER